MTLFMEGKDVIMWNDIISPGYECNLVVNDRMPPEKCHGCPHQ